MENSVYTNSAVRRISLFLAATVALACLLGSAMPAFGAPKLCMVQELESVGQFIQEDARENCWQEICGMSANGRYLLVHTGNFNGNHSYGKEGLYIKDMKSGVSKTVWEYANEWGFHNKKHTYGWASTGTSPISANGRYVVFSSNKSYPLKKDTNKKTDVFLYDNKTGKARLISKNAKGVPGNASSDMPVVSGNGRYVFYTSSATNLTRGSKKEHPGFYRYDTKKKTTSRLPISKSMLKGHGRDYVTDDGKNAVSGVSYSGRYIAFAYSESYLGTVAACRYDVKESRLLRLKKPKAKNFHYQGNILGITKPFLSGRGNRMAFLAGNDKGGYLSNAVFVQDCKTGGSALASRRSPQKMDDWYSYSHAMSQNGRYVAYNFWCQTRKAGYDVEQCIYLYDRVKKKRQLVKRFYCKDPSLGGDATRRTLAKDLYISKDGRYIGVTVWSEDGERDVRYRIKLKFMVGNIKAQKRKERTPQLLQGAQLCHQDEVIALGGSGNSIHRKAY
jgi:hypothetical protein